MFGFSPFHLGHAVCHDACCGLHIQHAVFDNACADGNGYVHIARIADVAASAAVNATLDGFELVDDFHGVHLGRTCERASRESGFEHIHCAKPFGERALHIAHDVHDMAVALHHKGFGDLHRARFGNAPNVVTRQINQHDVLGAFFGVVNQLLFGGFV